MIGIGKKAGFIVSGETGCVQAIKKSKCKLMILASDASDNTKDKFMSLCNKNNIKLITIGSKTDLGSAIGKSLTSTVVVVDDRFSSTLLDVISKGITCK
jgi:ribosomal protein L7Ae-like RNA K-turn-binding protein